MTHAHLLPDGSIDVLGARYRVHQREGLSVFEVLRESDGELVGCFELTDGGEVPKVRVLPGSADGGLTHTVGELLSAPRGVLPLQ